MCLLCTLLPVLVGLICAILGYLLGRLASKNNEELIRLSEDLESCSNEKERLLSLNAGLKSDLDECSRKFNKLETYYNGMKIGIDDWKNECVSLRKEFDEFGLEPAASLGGSDVDAAMAASGKMASFISSPLIDLPLIIKRFAELLALSSFSSLSLHISSL